VLNGIPPNQTFPAGTNFNFAFDPTAYFTNTSKLQFTYKLLSGTGLPDWFLVNPTPKTMSGKAN
jgi:hypothetical protein